METKLMIPSQRGANPMMSSQREAKHMMLSQRSQALDAFS